MSSNENSPNISRNWSFDDAQLVDELYDSLDYDAIDLDFDRTRDVLARFVQRETIDHIVGQQIRKAKEMATSCLPDSVRSTLWKRASFDKLNKNVKEAYISRKAVLQEAIKGRKEKLEKKIRAPPFLRTSDKIGFTVGIIAMCLTEYILLKQPEFMPIWYTMLIFPLLSARYYFYHKAKFHYFMLDFCYYVQVMTLFWLHVTPYHSTLFQVLFAASNGPLAIGIVMWRNSLVFHDLDKITSVFIHSFPPLVTFCLRWYPANGDITRVCSDMECHPSPTIIFGYTLVFYIIWQILYILKTEYLDKKKIENDKDIITTARFWTIIKPHPIYLWFKKKGYNFHPVIILSGCQFIYTLLTLLPIIPIYMSFELHCIYLSIIFLVCVWNGANFYFEIFTETYRKRLHRFLKEAEPKSSNATIVDGETSKVPEAENVDSLYNPNPKKSSSQIGRAHV